MLHLHMMEDGAPFVHGSTKTRLNEVVGVQKIVN